MRSERELVAEGQVEGHVVQVFKAMTARGADFTFRIVKADKIIHDNPARYDSIQTAFDAAVMFLIPNAEPLHLPEASAKDLEALNALLYVGGLQDDITSAEEAVMFKATFEHALDAVRAVREQAPKDLDAARLIVASTHGAFHKAALDISKISGVFDAQCLVFEMILERSIETIDAFLTGYGQ